MKYLTFLLALTLASISQTSAAATRHSLVTELQTSHVNVTMTFTGQDILIFGALFKPGDVIIKVTSPDIGVDLSQKKAIGPFWLDSGKITVRHTPGLFYLLSSRALDKIMSKAEQQKYGLQLRAALSKAQVDSAAASKMGDWQTAFLKLKQDGGLFRQLPHAVKVEEKRLFAATIQLPANIPLGTYHLDIYLVQNGHVISHQTRNLEVNQVQLEHWVANTVNRHSWGFGIAFTVFALFLGLTLGMALRRGSDS